MPNILHDANDRVSVGAALDYGDVRTNWNRTAAGWSEILGVKVTAEKALLCMIWVKVCREVHKAKRDNLVDIAGYARCLEIVGEHQEP